jgi:hypothetical protein
MGRSSADPGQLLDYGGAGAWLSDDLRVRAVVVADALAALGAAADPQGFAPGTGELGVRVADLAGDWAHLDTFVGDVGSGFALAGNAEWNGDRATLAPGVVRVADSRVAARGRVGFADRDTARREAREDAAAIRRALDDGSTVAEIEALAHGIGRGRHDPAYAARFAEILGPQGMVDIVGLIDDAYRSTGPEIRPAPGWGVDQLAPFGAVLTTGFDALRHPAAESRLPPGWLDDFLDIGMDAGTAFEHSLLVSQATLPSWAVLSLAEAHVTDRIRSGDGPTVEVNHEGMLVWGPEASSTMGNVLEGLGNCPSAATTWLTGTDTGGRTNAEALLAYELSPHYELHHRDVADRLATGIGHGASSVWAAGLPGADADLFHAVVDTAAADGRLRLPGMEPGLAQGAAARMDIVETRINDGFRLDAQEGTRRFEDTAVFLREVMRDEGAAATLRSAAGDHLQGRLRQLPAPGADRDAALQVAGRTMGVLAQAAANAAIADGRAADALAGANAGAVDYVASWVPGLGPVNDLLGGAGGGAGEWLFGDSRADEAGDAAQRRIFLANRALAATVAVHHVESGAVDPRAASEAAWSAVEALDLDIDRATVDGLFLDPAGNPRPSLPPVDQMTPAERRAFYAWVFSADLPADRPASEDYNLLRSAAAGAGNKVVYEA